MTAEELERLRNNPVAFLQRCLTIEVPAWQQKFIEQFYTERKPDNAR